MTDSAPPIEQSIAPPLPSGDPDRPGFWQRVSDRVNPILVRETHQSLSGRVFLVTLALAVSAVVITMMFATFTDVNQQAEGRQVFTLCVACLAPIALFVLPLQAFSAMRQEVTGGVAEQLLMTRLRPRRIVLGKLASGFLQFVMFLSVFAPVMALTFLLRGVDVPTILLTIFFAFLSSFAANAMCVALGAVGRHRVVSQLMQLIASVALFFATMGVWAGAWELAGGFSQMLRDPDFWPMMAGVLSMFVAGTALFILIATTSLAHAYENRSTPFRLYATCIVVLFYAWMLWVDAASGQNVLERGAPGMAALAAPILAPFWLWAACEDTALSPRVRTLVPKNRFIAWLSVPFLPGGGRGLLFTWQLAALTLALGLGLPLLLGVTPHRQETFFAVCAWSYVLIYAVLGRAIRSRLGPGTQRTLAAFLMTIALMLALILAPLIVDFLASGTSRHRWHPGHAMDPFFTILEAEGEPWEWAVGWSLIGAALVLLVLSSLRIRTDIGEALAASRRRRSRAT